MTTPAPKSAEQTLDRRLELTIYAMKATEPESGIDTCHITAAQEAAKELVRLRTAVAERENHLRVLAAEAERGREKGTTLPVGKALALHNAYIESVRATDAARSLEFVNGLKT